MLFINVYSVGQAYGGSEEGGWWYETGDCVLTRKCRTRKVARRILKSLRAQFKYTGKRTSVLQGEDYDVSIETEAGTYFPKQRPYYC